MRQFEFLNEEFLEAMNDIGRLGSEKFGAECSEARGDGVRRIPRHQKEQNLRHAHEHLVDYAYGTPHDKLETMGHQLAAVAFNAMVEFYFSQHEQGK